MNPGSDPCPHTGCGHVNRPDSQFCARCGRPLPQSDFEIEWRWVWWWLAPVGLMFAFIWLTIAPVREYSPFLFLAIFPFVVFGVRRRRKGRRWWWRDHSEF